MKKNYYIAPDICSVVCKSENMIAASVFNTEENTQIITFSNEEVNEFTSRRGRDLWDEE